MIETMTMDALQFLVKRHKETLKLIQGLFPIEDVLIYGLTSDGMLIGIKGNLSDGNKRAVAKHFSNVLDFYVHAALTEDESLYESLKGETESIWKWIKQK